MNDLRTAAQQALEALESVLCDPDGKCCIDGSDADRAVVDKALTALERALAQQAEPVEPVALKHRHEWFRTGGMEPGQFRCIHCGVWGQEQPDPQIADRLARHGIPKP